MRRFRCKHVRGGLYYVVLCGTGGRAIFFDNEDRQHLTDLVATVAKRYFAHVLAYCWTPSDARLVIEITDMPIGRIIQGIAVKHARHINEKRGERGYVFHKPCRRVLIDRQTELLSVVRHVHRTPIAMELTPDLETYQWSSHRIYLGKTHARWLTTNVVFDALGSNLDEQTQAYQKLMMTEGEGRNEVEGAGDCAAQPGKAGDIAFLSKFDGRHTDEKPTVSLDQIIDAVCRRMSVERTQLLSERRHRRLAEARALITWHATRNNICSLTAAAQKLGRDPSSVYVSSERYRKLHRSLFGETLAELLNDGSHTARRRREKSKTAHRQAINGHRSNSAFIVQDPSIMGGTPVLAGTHVPVQALFAYLVEGASIKDFLKDFPRVSRELAIGALRKSEELMISSIRASS